MDKKFEKYLLFILFLLALGITSICYASDYDLTGTWKGYLNSNLGYASVTMELEQYEDGTFTGSWKASSGGRGTAGGKLKGRSLKFKLNNRASGCSGSFSGKGRLSSDGEQIRGSFSGKDCAGKWSGKGKLYLQD